MISTADSQNRAGFRYRARSSVAACSRVFPAVALLLASLPACTRPGAGSTKPDVAGLDPGTLREQRFSERRLSAGEAHVYDVYLEAGQYLEAEVDQRGIDVVIEALAPGGKRLALFDSPTNRHGPELVFMVAEEPGRHRLLVRPLYRELTSGRYGIRIRTPREAGPEDRHRSAAMKVTWRARQVERVDPRAALSRLSEALGHWRAAGDRAREALTHEWAGNLQGELGEWIQALEHHRRALSLWQELGDRAGEAKSWLYLGQIYLNLEDEQTALDYLHLGLRIAERSVDDFSRGEGLLRRGIGSARSGDQTAALVDLKSSLEIWERIKHLQRQAFTLNEIGSVYEAQGSYRKALGFYQQALVLRQRIDHVDDECMTILRISGVRAAMGEIDEALRSCGEALACTRRRQLSWLAREVFVMLGEIYSTFDEQTAAEHYRRSTTLCRRWSNERAYSALARLARRAGRLGEAQEWIYKALQDVESGRARGAYPQMRVSLRESQRAYYTFAVDLLMERHRLEPARGYDAEAFRMSERARARNLVESLAVAGERTRVDPVLLGGQRRLRERLETLFQEQSRQRLQRVDGARLSAIGEELKDLLRRYDELEARIRASNPRYAELMQPAPLSVDELRRRVLGDETLLLEYALGEERSYLWAVTQGTFTSYELPPRSVIEDQALEVYELLTARNRRFLFEAEDEWQRRIREADRRYPSAAAALSELLLAPVADLLADHRRLLVVGERALQYIPFAALPEPRHRRPATAFRPLIDDLEVVSAPSASVLAALQKTRGRARLGVAALADPVFERGDPRVADGRGLGEQAAAAGDTRADLVLGDARADLLRSARDVGLKGFSRLHFTRQEADAIFALASGEDNLKALGFAARRELVTAGGLAEYRILHFASHSIVNSRRPELSGIVLSLVDERGAPQDGFLRLHDIYNLELAADLVVLSACDTALGKEIAGEGLAGLSRGFMYAGVPAVLGSLWSPQDQTTAELMKRFYRGLLGEGLAPAAALRRAQMEMRRQSGSQAPYYWAAFILQGEWRLTSVPLSETAKGNAGREM